MSETRWTKNELVAYILLYVANIDLVESSKEKTYILSRVDKEVYESVYKEFSDDNDYQSITKITDAVKHQKLFSSFEELFAEIKLMAFADGEFHQMEQTVYNSIKRLLKS
ncbi:MAG: hypothetical protein HRU50_13530 [Winogradskyella sp.]|uniref:hypothetical protein n=1 Tax=Winogradskyella sp. TaxID=1883156 RepID=UPI0025FA16CB|nr:hypothetical protein [Winogradskyella sp.]NRB60945.1 hypothetical protein [Winogradskyella sp.]